MRTRQQKLNDRKSSRQWKLDQKQMENEVRASKAKKKQSDAEAYALKKKADSDFLRQNQDLKRTRFIERQKTLRFSAAAGAASNSMNSAAKALADWNKVASGTNPGTQNGSGGAGKTTGNQEKDDNKVYNPYTGKWEDKRKEE